MAASEQHATMSPFCCCKIFVTLRPGVSDWLHAVQPRITIPERESPSRRSPMSSVKRSLQNGRYARSSFYNIFEDIEMYVELATVGPNDG